MGTDDRIRSVMIRVIRGLCSPRRMEMPGILLPPSPGPSGFLPSVASGRSPHQRSSAFISGSIPSARCAAAPSRANFRSTPGRWNRRWTRMHADRPFRRGEAREGFDSARSILLCSESRQGFRPPADKQRSASFSLCRIDLGSLRSLLSPPGVLRISVHLRSSAVPFPPPVAPLRRRARSSDRFASDPSSRPSVPRPERQGTDSRRHGATFRSAGLTPPRPG